MNVNQINKKLDEIVNSPKPNFSSLNDLSAFIGSMKFDVEARIKVKKFPKSSSFVNVTNQTGELAKGRASLLMNSPIELILQQLESEKNLSGNDFIFTLTDLVKNSDRDASVKRAVMNWEKDYKKETGVTELESELKDIGRCEKKYNIINGLRSSPDFNSKARERIQEAMMSELMPSRNQSKIEEKNFKSETSKIDLATWQELKEGQL